MCVSILAGSNFLLQYGHFDRWSSDALGGGPSNLISPPLSYQIYILFYLNILKLLIVLNDFGKCFVLLFPFWNDRFIFFLFIYHRLWLFNFYSLYFGSFAYLLMFHYSITVEPSLTFWTFFQRGFLFILIF